MKLAIAHNWHGDAVDVPLEAELKHTNTSTLSLELTRAGAPVGEVYIEFDQGAVQLRIYHDENTPGNGAPNVRVQLGDRLSKALLMPAALPDAGIRAEIHDDAETLSLGIDAKAYFDQLSDVELAEFVQNAPTERGLSDDVAFELSRHNPDLAAFFRLKSPQQRGGETNGFECNIDPLELGAYTRRRLAASTARQATEQQQQCDAIERDWELIGRPSVAAIAEIIETFADHHRISLRAARLALLEALAATAEPSVASSH